MATKKIKGITIKLGADTSAIDKALKDINHTSAGLNTELKEVNKLLKFDPKNTTLIAQKQEILADAVENTKKKLDALKQAQSEVEKLFKSGEIGINEYRQFQRTLEETEQSLKSYKQQQGRLEQEQKKLGESTKQLHTLLEATGKSLDEFQDILGSKLTNALKNGTANSDELTVAINKIGKAALGSDTDLGKMRDALNQIDEGSIGDVRRALEELSSQSEKTEEDLSKIGEGVATGNLLDAADQFSEVGDKVLDIGSKALETSQDLENASKKVNAYFGETGAAAQENADIIKRVYESGVGGSLETVADAVVAVKENLEGLDNVSLEKIVSQAVTLEEIYGIDMNESLRGINALMEYFGLDAQKAMDLLVSGTQNGLDKTNELGDNLSEYSGKFAEAGYSAEEYFQLLENGLDAGAYNLDKVNDAINEVTTRIADGTIEDSMSKIDEKTGELVEGTGGWSKSVEDVFKKWQNGEATQKQVIDAIVQDIQNTENQQEKLNKSALAFGTMAEDGSTKFVSALTTVGDSYTDISGKAAQMQKETTTSAQEMESAARRIQDAFAPIGGDLVDILTPALEVLAELAEMFSSLPEPVRNFVEIFGGIAAVVAVITPIIGAITILNGALVTLVGIGLAPVLGIVAAVSAAIVGIIAVIKNWGAITDWLSEKWGSFKEWISGLWESIVESASETWEGIRTFFSDLWTGISDTASGIWTGMSNTVRNIWEGIVTFFQEVWNRIYNVIAVPLNLIKGIIEGVMYAIYAVIYTVWEVVRITLQNVWNGISSMAAAIFVPIAQFFTGLWEGISSTAASVWETITGTLSGVWNGIKNTAGEIFTQVRDFFSGIWNKIKTSASDVWNGIKSTLGGIWDSIYGKAKDAFGKIFSFIKDGFRNLKNTIGDIVKGVANAIISPIGSAVNGVISGVNWILDKVGSKKQFAKWKVSKFARGTGGLKEDTIGVVNDQKGSIYKEMIVPPHGDPFIPEGRDVVLPMEKGTKILPAKETKSFLEELPHFADGIGEWFNGAWSTVKDIAGTVWDYVTHPGDLVKAVVNKFVKFSDALEPGLSIAKGVVNTVFDSVTGFVKKLFETESPSVKYNPSAGVEQWRSLAAKALRMTNQYSEANLNRLLMQMQTESGGNPNAINNWDINAKRGTPSKGLMQVIDPTFRANAMPGYDKNIYDPLSNMLAAIRYTVRRYGSLARGWKGHGYENGVGEINLENLFSVPVLDVSWFKEGGILTKPAAFPMGNGRMGVAGEGKEAEAITPISKLKDYVKDAVGEVLSDKEFHITIHLEQKIDKKTLARELIPISVPLTKQYQTRKNRLGGVRENGASKSYI